ncbi:hypothetical protein HPB50_011910 [Hyalomma asiaticum]|uniref:Uncharacterized protein n=1 Tax=Hyalomma asiaticum TaxID=266040 RepID=A0ACB7TF49_HYAAI|nr:hypothetical protein HPB50_011910 [Hyalomma asiaticum]
MAVVFAEAEKRRADKHGVHFSPPARLPVTPSSGGRSPLPGGSPPSAQVKEQESSPVITACVRRGLVATPPSVLLAGTLPPCSVRGGRETYSGRVCRSVSKCLFLSSPPLARVPVTPSSVGRGPLPGGSPPSSQAFQNSEASRNDTNVDMAGPKDTRNSKVTAVSRPEHSKSKSNLAALYSSILLGFLPSPHRSRAHGTLNPPVACCDRIKSRVILRRSHSALRVRWLGKQGEENEEVGGSGLCAIRPPLHTIAIYNYSVLELGSVLTAISLRRAGLAPRVSPAPAPARGAVAHGKEVRIPRDKPVLLKDAVPTILPNLPQYLTKTTPKPRNKRKRCESDEGPTKKSQSAKRGKLSDRSELSPSSPEVSSGIDCDSANSAQEEGIAVVSQQSVPFIFGLKMPSKYWSSHQLPDLDGVLYCTSTFLEEGVVTSDKVVLLFCGKQPDVNCKVYMRGRLIEELGLKSREEAENVLKSVHAAELCRRPECQGL